VSPIKLYEAVKKLDPNGPAKHCATFHNFVVSKNVCGLEVLDKKSKVIKMYANFI